MINDEVGGPDVTAELATFNFDDHPVRVVMIEGEPWWVAKDVCDALRYANASAAVAQHVRKERRKTLTLRSSNRGNPTFTTINEAGLCQLIMGSELPDAVRFQDWVFDEVLPSIRRTGQYSVVPPRNQFDVWRGMIDQIETLTEESARNTARLDALEGRRDWFSALGYCKYRGLRTDLEFTQILGKAASRVGKSHGVLPNKVQDARFGLVNQWPLAVWDETRERISGMEKLA